MTQTVPVRVQKMVPEQQVRRVPYTVTRQVVERVERQVPVKVCRYVQEEHVRTVPVTYTRMMYEQRIEDVQVRVCKMIATQESVCVPRVVRRLVPVCDTCCVPRTVVVNVPGDACCGGLASGPVVGDACCSNVVQGVPLPALPQEIPLNAVPADPGNPPPQPGLPQLSACRSRCLLALGLPIAQLEVALPARIFYDPPAVFLRIQFRLDAQDPDGRPTHLSRTGFAPRWHGAKLSRQGGRTSKR